MTSVSDANFAIDVFDGVLMKWPPSDPSFVGPGLTKIYVCI